MDDTERLRELVLLRRSSEYEELMCRCILHELEVVGRVLVVTSYIQRHHLLKEFLGSRVVGEEGIAVDMKELAFVRMRASLGDRPSG